MKNVVLKKAKKQLQEVEKRWGTDKVKYIKQILYELEEGEEIKNGKTNSM